MLIFFVFLGIYSLFYSYLKNFFADNICMMGLVMILAVGMLNDKNIIFLIVFYIIYLITNKKLYTKKSFIVIILSLICSSTIYCGLRWKLGFQFFRKHCEHLFNDAALYCGTLIFVVLSIKAYKLGSKFFKWSFISLSIFLFYFSSLKI